MAEKEDAGASPLDSPSTELASRRTGMAFQRTRLAAERTLMSVIRTSLSLISFGFTIHQVFERLKENEVIQHASSGRNFGITLVVLGVLMLLIGIVYHLWFMYALRQRRGSMVGDDLLHGESPFPPSMTLITALLLFALGIAAFVSMALKVGPYD